MMACTKKLSVLAALAVGLALPCAAVSDALAQQGAQGAARQPTLLTPRIGSGGTLPPTQQQGSLPQPQQPQLTPEQRRKLLQFRIMEIEGGRAYVRQACGDPTWVEDYKVHLEKIEITDRPKGILAFKNGWEESKLRLGPDIVSCEELMSDS